jgi:hypothetical protein
LLGSPKKATDYRPSPTYPHLTYTVTVLPEVTVPRAEICNIHPVFVRHQRRRRQAAWHPYVFDLICAGLPGENPPKTGKNDNSQKEQQNKSDKAVRHGLGGSPKDELFREGC